MAPIDLKRTVILDAGPIIHGSVEFLRNICDSEAKVLTVPQVLNEIKDENTRHKISNLLPFPIESCVPSETSFNYIMEEAKRIGDYASLSKTDLLVAALAYEMHTKYGNQSENQGTPNTVIETDKNEIADDKGDQVEDDGWITPSNISKKKQLAQEALNKEMSGLSVFCVSFDFAIQNLLLNLKVPVIASEGNLVKSLRTYVLRCYGCYSYTKDMSKRFCPDCGNNTLTKVTASIDSDGTLRMHLKEGYKVFTRGTKYAIPIPKGERGEKVLILREDQKEFARAVKRSERVMKKALSAENEVFQPEYLPTMYQSTKEREKQLRQMSMSEVMVGYGRKNPNHGKKRTGNK